jgi:hypothetical protein
MASRPEDVADFLRRFGTEGLTPRKAQIASLFAAGKTKEEIAKRFEIPVERVCSDLVLIEAHMFKRKLQARAARPA